jgi:hypothetical protein
MYLLYLIFKKTTLLGDRSNITSIEWNEGKNTMACAMI